MTSSNTNNAISTHRDYLPCGCSSHGTHHNLSIYWHSCYIRIWRLWKRHCRHPYKRTNVWPRRKNGSGVGLQCWQHASTGKLVPACQWSSPTTAIKVPMIMLWIYGNDDVKDSGSNKGLTPNNVASGSPSHASSAHCQGYHALQIRFTNIVFIVMFAQHSTRSSWCISQTQAMQRPVMQKCSKMTWAGSTALSNPQTERSSIQGCKTNKTGAWCVQNTDTSGQNGYAMILVLIPPLDRSVSIMRCSSNSPTCIGRTLKQCSSAQDWALKSRKGGGTLHHQWDELYNIDTM